MYKIKQRVTVYDPASEDFDNQVRDIAEASSLTEAKAMVAAFTPTAGAHTSIVVFYEQA